MTACARELPPLAASNLQPVEPKIEVSSGVTEPPSPVPVDRACGTSAWPTYGHDAARTSASDGCVEGPLVIQWTFEPRSFKGRKPRPHHAIVASGAVYLQALRGDSPVVHQLSEDGAEGWTFDTRADIHREHWPSFALGKLWVNDDGFYLVDPATGKDKGKFLDSWGPTLTDGTRLFAKNALQVEGPGLFVAAFDANGRALWQDDKLRVAQMFEDPLGGIALDQGTLFHAANYRFPNKSSVSAFDAATGARKWSVPTTPMSPPAAAGGKLFLVESDCLVARSQTSGERLWASPIEGARGASPVIAGDRVIVHGASAVVAFDLAGEEAWKAPLPRWTPKDIGSPTTMAAATGTGTLVVTSGTDLHVLALDSGKEQWKGPLPESAHSPVVVGRALYVVAGRALHKLYQTTR